jgi:hypothetical protein
MLMHIVENKVFLFWVVVVGVSIMGCVSPLNYNLLYFSPVDILRLKIILTK